MKIEIDQKKKSKWWQKMLDILLVILVVFSIFLAYGFGINNRFYKLMVVTSGSMSPVFEAGDVIFIERMDSTEAKVGDIVTFQTMDNLILTHRIVEIKNDGEIITRGDANNTNDVWNDGWKLKKVEAKYVFKIPYLGYAISWLRGIFPEGMNTGAWLTDAKNAEFNLTADTWEVATPSNSILPESSDHPDLPLTVLPQPSVEPEKSTSPSITPESPKPLKPISIENNDYK